MNEEIFGKEASLSSLSMNEEIFGKEASLSSFSMNEEIFGKFKISIRKPNEVCLRCVTYIYH